MWLPPDELGVAPNYEQLDIQKELAAGALVPVASGMPQHRDDAAISIGTGAPPCTRPDSRRGSLAPRVELAGGDHFGPAPTMLTSASVTLTPSTGNSGSDVHSNGSGVKVTSTPLTVIVT